MLTVRGCKSCTKVSQSLSPDTETAQINFKRKKKKKKASKQQKFGDRNEIKTLTPRRGRRRKKKKKLISGSNHRPSVLAGQHLGWILITFLRKVALMQYYLTTLQDHIFILCSSWIRNHFLLSDSPLPLVSLKNTTFYSWN